ncbi:hypothetical protein L1987_22857 [Smallanthus sonchifolius]|uniref:Uncharacterized protein n=1 Tax=Smallanthus sonchifolius TaxID=185202 RepID=A0ACB9IG08_9ASTR|nr:hypothetical protein L1987_22857 [Smallanthus sonchifolius]
MGERLESQIHNHHLWLKLKTLDAVSLSIHLKWGPRRANQRFCVTGGSWSFAGALVHGGNGGETLGDSEDVEPGG